MFSILSSIASGALAFILLVVGMTFAYTTKAIPAPRKGEERRAAQLRLWRAFKANLRTTFTSTIFWGFAGLVTAMIIFGSLTR